MTPLHVVHTDLGGEVVAGTPYKIVTTHGEGASTFNVIDTRAPEGEQPCIVAGFLYRYAAQEWIATASATAKRNDLIRMTIGAGVITRGVADLGPELMMVAAKAVRGNVITVRPTSPRGKAWLDERVEAAPWQWLGDILCIDHALAGDLIAWMLADGLAVE